LWNAARSTALAWMQARVAGAPIEACSTAAG
jgi:hypothetical protein